VALRLLEAHERPSPVDLRFGRLQLKAAGSGLDGVLVLHSDDVPFPAIPAKVKG
jgi:hypothetical protein